MTEIFNDTDLLKEEIAAGGNEMRFYPEVTAALARVKEACAKANAKLGCLAPDAAEAVALASREIAEGRTVLPPMSASRALGAPLEALVNETAARRASTILGRRVGPELVNMNQSVSGNLSAVASIEACALFDALIAGAWKFADDLESRARDFKGVITAGRVGMRDGLPVSLGDEFHGWAAGVRRNAKRLTALRGTFGTVSLGSGELGNGLGVPPLFGKEAAAALSEASGCALTESEEPFDTLYLGDRLLLAHAHIQALSSVVWRCAGELCLMCSGPRCGLGEITFPAVAPGSSIMPGKVNPTVGQMVMHVCDYIKANHTAMMHATDSGWLGNGAVPGLPLRALADSAKLLTNAMDVFSRKVLSGITAHPEHCLDMAGRSLALAAVLASCVGKEKAREALNLALKENISVGEAALTLKLMSKEDFERAAGLAART